MIAWALRKSLQKYNFDTFKHDFIAALIVSLITLPLAMALAIAVVAPATLFYTAIIAGICAPLLGGSYYQVSGPATAFVVIIAPIVSVHGLHGLIITTVIAGLILISMGVLKFGQYIVYVPYPVTTGFTSGIAIVLSILSINDFLGLNIGKMPESFFGKIAAIAERATFIQWPEALIGIVSLIVMFASSHFSKKILQHY